MNACMPVKPFQCWVYRKDAPSVPMWAAHNLLVQDSGVAEFVWPDNGGQVKLDEGDVFVMFDSDDLTSIQLYSAAEFGEKFRAVPEAS